MDCQECNQPVFLKLGPWPAFFGHIHTMEDWAEFQHDGLCALCAHYLADFAAMKDRKGMYL